MASIALLAGLGGLALGVYALLRTREVRGEYQVLAQRALAVNNSGADPRAVRDVAVLHYDALEEMSGARSFSLAMLNSHGDGVVVTSINGRSETRTYAKAVTRGEADHLLSPEEYRVIRSARLGNGIGSAPPAPAEQRPAQPVGTGAEEDPEALVTVVQGPDKAGGERADGGTEQVPAEAPVQRVDAGTDRGGDTPPEPEPRLAEDSETRDGDRPPPGTGAV
jgi:hypothetical protein